MEELTPATLARLLAAMEPGGVVSSGPRLQQLATAAAEPVAPAEPEPTSPREEADSLELEHALARLQSAQAGLWDEEAVGALADAARAAAAAVAKEEEESAAHDAAHANAAAKHAARAKTDAEAAPQQAAEEAAAQQAAEQAAAQHAALDTPAAAPAAPLPPLLPNAGSANSLIGLNADSAAAALLVMPRAAQAAAVSGLPPAAAAAALSALPTALAGSARDPLRWRLVFTSSAADVRSAAGGGRFFPITAVQSWDADRGRIVNGVYLGHIAALQFSGPCRLTGKRLEFNFDGLTLKLLGGVARFSLKPAGYALPPKGTKEAGALPFFLFAHADEHTVVARGRSGGVAFWARAEPAWLLTAGATQL